MSNFGINLHYITVATKQHPVLEKIIERVKKQNEQIKTENRKRKSFESKYNNLERDYKTVKLDLEKSKEDLEDSQEQCQDMINFDSKQKSYIDKLKHQIKTLGGIPISN